MNKKFSTLAVGLLLAGGLFSTAEAAVQHMEAGQYYRIAVAAKGATHEQNAYFLDSDKDSWWVAAAELDNDGSSWWRVETVKDPIINNVIAYKLVNKKGVYYTVKDGDDEYSAFVEQNATGAVDLAAGGTLNQYWTLKPYGVTEDKYAYEGQLVASSETYWGYDNVKIEPIAQDAAALKEFQGTKFNIRIGYDAKKTGDTKEKFYDYTSFVGTNVFANDLYPVDIEGSNGLVALYTDAKLTKRIVLTKTKWDQFTSETGSGYKFAVLSAREYATAIAKTGDDATILADKFKFSVPATTTEDPLELAAYDDLNNSITDASYEVVVSVVSNATGAGENRLTVVSNTTENYAECTKALSSGVHNTHIIFGASNFTDMSIFYDKLWNIVSVAGAIASPSCSGDEFVPAAQVNLTLPEGQWLWNGSVFVNRESGKELDLGVLRNTAKANVYEATGLDMNVTITKAGVPGSTFDGYLNGYTTDQLKQKAFFIGTPIMATLDTVYLAKDAKNGLYLTADKSEAVEFRLTKSSYKNTDDVVCDVVKHFTTYLGLNKDNEVVEKTDTLNWYTYRVTETVTGLGLRYDNVNKKYILGGTENDEDDEYNAYYEIIFKAKSEDTYNMISNGGHTNGDDVYLTQDNSMCYSSKLYGAHNTAELVGTTGAYAYTQNDLFVIEDADAARYRSVADLENIKIFRNADNNYVMYEKGEFLGIENIQDDAYAKMAPAMVADPAAGKGTYRPQYLLGVQLFNNEGKECPLTPEHNTQEWIEENGGYCQDARDTEPYTSGRYLVNLVDSADAAKAAGVLDKNNKFMFQNYLSSYPYYKLAFVPAIHKGDSLIIATPEATAADTINLTNNDVDKVCTFAFRYVDANRDAFIIETLYKNYVYTNEYDEVTVTPQRGYLKYHNGLPVVTDERSEAEVFDLETTDEVATSNEEIVAASEVSVVAVNGAIIVKGAAGKVVTVANILGQTIANQVAASDNVTIAAPAGVAVVTVDGEATKVIVK